MAVDDYGIEVLKKAGEEVTAGDKSDYYIKTAGLNGLVTVPFDYISLSETSTTDVYTYKNGGSGGTTVATVTITYTDSTKCTISTVESV